MSSAHRKRDGATAAALDGGEDSSATARTADRADTSAEDVERLWRRWRQAGDSTARAALVDLFKPLAKTIAAVAYARRTGNEAEFDDYLHFSYQGLLEALERYDPGRGAQFKTFAAPRMRGAILSGLERHSESARRAATRRRLELERIESFIPERIPERHDEALARLGDVGVSIAIAFILDAIGLGADGAERGAHPYVRDEPRALQEQAWDMVARLGDRERFVVEQHYRHGRPFAALADELGVSRARISQIHRDAIARVRVLISKGVGCDVTF